MNDQLILSEGLKLITDRMGFAGLARFIQLAREIRSVSVDNPRHFQTIWLPCAKPFDNNMIGMGVEMTDDGTVNPIPNGAGNIVGRQYRDDGNDLVGIMLD